MVSFRPGQAGSSEEEQMDLLSGTVSFLVANGNATNDEARSFLFCFSTFFFPVLFFSTFFFFYFLCTLVQ